MRSIGWLLLIVSLALVAAGCGGDDDDGSQTQAETGAASTSELTVYAATSLTEVFPAIDPAPEYSFAGSDELATQIREGAPADVFAAASSRYPQELFDEGLVEEPVTFASNRLVVVVPTDNRAGIDSIEDVTEPGTKLVVAAEGVPVGDYTRQVLDDLDLTAALANIVSNEDDVRGVLAKVALGEGDAGFVYITDAVVAEEDVTVVELPEGSQPPIEYQIAVVSASQDREAAQAFVDKVLAPDGQQALEAAGFTIP